MDASSPTVVALGRAPAFVRWISEVAHDREVEVCPDLGGVLRGVQPLETEFVAVYLPDVELERAPLLDQLRAAGRDVPIVAVVADVTAGETVELLALGFACALPVTTPIPQAREALRNIRHLRARIVASEKTVRDLVSRLHDAERWGAGTKRKIDELVHEFRTPIAVMQGFCSNLIDGVHGPLTPEQQTNIERMKVAAGMLLEVVNRSRGQLAPPPPRDKALPDQRSGGRRPLDLAELCEEVVGLLRPVASRRGIQLAFGRAECPPVWGDRPRLSQVLINLLENACRFAPKGSSVEVLLGVAPTGSLPAHRACRVTVRDRGAGIPATQQEQVFLAGWTTDRASGHSGMGLAICRQIADEHRGSLTLESASGQGTAFHLLLPVDPRSRCRTLAVSVVEDIALAGQLLLELHRMEALHPETRRPEDMVALAAQLAAEGGHLSLIGPLDERLQTVLGLISNG